MDDPRYDGERGQLMKKEEIGHLLWTGGWDSTFRLLDLVISHKTKVQPYYIIDAGRPSTGFELRTIRNITNLLIEEHPLAREILLPIKYHGVEDIKPNAKITKSYYELRRKYHIGSQYDWLARFAHQNGLQNLELSIAHQDGRVFQALHQFVVRHEIDGSAYFVIDPQCAESDVFTLFSNMRFPILDISKVEMGRLAKEAGFYHLLESSWFCHVPRSNGKPCGLCNPCAIAIEEGLAWRLPLISRVKYYLKRYSRFHLYMYFAALERAREYPKVFSLAREIKRKLVRFCCI
jgi:hypothetical protein